MLNAPPKLQFCNTLLPSDQFSGFMVSASLPNPNLTPETGFSHNLEYDTLEYS